MAAFVSCIYTKDGRILFHNSHSHEQIISKYNLKGDDITLKNRPFVRIECTPKDQYSLPSVAKVDSYRFKVDETGTLPSWFNFRQAEISCRAAIKKYLKAAYFPKQDMDKLANQLSKAHSSLTKKRRAIDLDLQQFRFSTYITPAPIPAGLHPTTPKKPRGAKTLKKTVTTKKGK